MSQNHVAKILTLHDLKELARIFSETFEHHYSQDESYLAQMLQNQSIVILGAYSNKQLIGGLVAFEFTPLTGNKEFYLYDIAVDILYQKKGIGRMLMDSIRNEAINRQITTIFIEAEATDLDAVAFYRALGGEELAVRHFNFRPAIAKSQS